MELHGETAKITRSLTVLKDFEWFADAFGNRVPKFAEFPEKITTVSGFCGAVSHLDGCVICVGNPDKKFGPLVEARKGSFMDSSGMYGICMHVKAKPIKMFFCRQESNSFY